MNLLESGEMYLETILVLSREKPLVRSIDVVNYMGFSKPSVSRAVKNLKDAGYINMGDDNYLSLTDSGREVAEKIYERAFNDFLKIWLYMDGPQAVLKYVHEKTGMKFNRHTKNHCDICRTIFTDKRIIPLIRDNFFDAAYYPLLLYNTRAEKENEERAKR